ncbi:MAG: hypothetical protein D6765_14640, partial [Bacteroidetes bacterium]
MPKLLLCFLGLLLGWSTAPAGYGQPATMSLAQCLAYAREHSPAIERSRLQVENVRLLIRENKAQGLPQLDVGLHYRRMLSLPVHPLPGEFFGMPDEVVPIRFGTDNFMDLGLNVRQVIYDRSLLSRRKMEDLAIGLQRLQVQQTEAETLEQAASLYLEWLQLLNRQKLLEGQERRLERLQALVQAQVANDFARPVDLQRLELESRKLELRKEELQAGIAQIEEGLKLLIGMPPEAQFQP